MIGKGTEISIVWLRRDLRIEDHAALHYALKSGLPVVPLFILDKDILDQLEDTKDVRVSFIYQTLLHINEQLTAYQSQLLIKVGKPFEVWKGLFKDFTVKKVFCNHDYEPYALTRDSLIEKLCKEHQCGFYSFKDQCIFEKDEITKDNGAPYTVFTPYSKKWLLKLSSFYLKPYPTYHYMNGFLRFSAPIPSLAEAGFDFEPFTPPPNTLSEEKLQKYALKRDLPFENETSRLGLHLRFGTISIRHLANQALNISSTFLNELIWREFYMMILYHFPHVTKGAFKPQYDKIPWNNDEKQFQLWCEGKTGYPLVDAGMRQLNQTGFMHNRVRMVTASFLTKHLLIDWRWGEAYFAKKLLDYDLAANNGGWQWAAGCGCDAAPYFRVFNPTLQQKKFDPNYLYVKQWIQEWGTPLYPQPII
ncbi:MAG TPA: deoxyribodipyrimidine photo-lyase, partial [Cytophagales bacterium]|nr:deoxyribodipyrimidine photo-lyase [Cytophagales bacterium]